MVNQRTPVNYANGKIYKLVNNVDNKIYIGSTATTLTKRLFGHKKDSKTHIDRFVYKHLNFIGWGSVSIVLIETFECKSKDELCARERHWYDTLKPELNSNIPKSICPHGREECNCKECNGAGICEHNRLKQQCKLCGGSSICEHNRVKSICEKCGGASICEHNKVKSHCRDCGGSSYCKHHKNKSFCKDCGGSGTKKIICVCGCAIRKYNMKRHELSHNHIRFTSLLKPVI